MNQGKNRTDENKKGRKKTREPTGHPVIGVRQLGADGLCLHIGGLERGLCSLKALPELH
jgi:hypothetical protein